MTPKDPLPKEIVAFPYQIINIKLKILFIPILELICRVPFISTDTENYKLLGPTASNSYLENH